MMTDAFLFLMSTCPSCRLPFDAILVLFAAEGCFIHTPCNTMLSEKYLTLFLLIFAVS